jgi:hypothetical protein
MRRSQTATSLIFDVLVGAVPATLLVFSLSFLFGLALEDPYATMGRSVIPLRGGVAVVLGAGGLLGAAGLWVAVLTAGDDRPHPWLRRLLVICLVAGIAAASVLLVGMLGEAFRNPRPGVYLCLLALGPIVVAGKYLVIWTLDRSISVPPNS